MWPLIIIFVLCFHNGFAFDQPQYPEENQQDKIEVRNFFYRNDIIYKFETSDTLSTFSIMQNTSKENMLKGQEGETAFQPWSILWYAGSFGGLIAFFLVISCSEWCCRANRRTANLGDTSPSLCSNESPPPAYDLFAPPSYESLCNKDEKKADFDIFVVPFHTVLTSNSINLNTDSSDLPPYFNSNETNSGVDLGLNEVVVNVASAESDFNARQKELRESATQT